MADLWGGSQRWSHTEIITAPFVVFRGEFARGVAKFALVTYGGGSDAFA